LSRRGFREIVLPGIHLSSYGEDLAQRTSLAGLLGALGGAAAPARLRLSSLDPRKTDTALLAHLAGSGAVCPHFHLSLQHRSGRVLRAMGRPVAEGSYEAILDEMKRLAPDAALGADLMAGFPGETEAEFDELRGFLDGSPLTYAHIFSYSPRPGTAAAARRPVPAGIVTERAKSLRRLAALKEFRFRRRFLGRELEAVVIRKSEDGAEVLTGNFIAVRVPSCPAPERERVRVAIRHVLPRRTEGEIVA
jgi:threonylcarbamoyladenosine tRNA methylthiotransferase MtaB